MNDLPIDLKLSSVIPDTSERVLDIALEPTLKKLPEPFRPHLVFFHERKLFDP